MDWKYEMKRVIEGLRWSIPDNVGVVFSGGIDSSFLAYMANMWDKNVHLYSAGTETSQDHDWVFEASDYLGLPLKFKIIHEMDILEAIKNIKRIDPRADALSILFDMPLYFSASISRERDLISGQGSDEIFMGYKKYEKLDSHEKDLEKLLSRDIPREKKIAELFGKQLITPYLDRNFVYLANQIPRELKISGGVHKKILREIAIEYGLNPKIAERPKKSAQYSSGIKDLLEKMAKIKGKKVYEFIRDL